MARQLPTVASHYREDGAEDYLKYQVVGAEIAARIALPRFTPYIRPTDTVVDFGCGTGWLLRVIDAERKVGIEPSPPAREVAASLGIETVAAPSEISEGFADVVVSNHALEHSLSPYTELVELLRILRPGARLVLGLPIDDWRSQRLPDVANPDHHLYTWSPMLLANLLGEAGFVVESARAFTYLQPYYNERLFPILPRRAFDLLAWAFGTVKRYRQLLAVAHKPAA